MKIKITINNPLEDIDFEKAKNEIDEFIQGLINSEIVICGNGIINESWFKKYFPNVEYKRRELK